MKFDGPLLNGRWRLGPRMGQGTQARTFLARDEKPGRRAGGRDGPAIVVVKQLELKKSGKTWKNFDLFEREVRVLKSLRHPGIPRFLEHFESEPGVFNLVIERMSGATLRAFATKIHFSDDELRDVLAKLLEILDYLHGVDPPVVHRDIKPANIVRDADGTIALVDFGGVREILHTEGGSTIVGTFGYMAPEQLHGQATPATDVYSVGATIVALAGGVEPENVPRRGLRMDLERHLGDRDPALRAVLTAMTEPDPEARPQTARDVAALLRRPSERAAAVIAPISPQALTTQTPSDLASRPFDEIGDMLESAPRPLGWILRLVLLSVAISGYVGITLIRAVALPLVFALIGAVSGARARPKVDEIRGEVSDALDEGRDGFRNLQQRCLPSRSSLPAKRERKLSRRERKKRSQLRGLDD